MHTKLLKTGLAIAVLFIASIFLLSRFLMQQQEKDNIRTIQDKGTHFLNLIALYPIIDSPPEKRAFFLRTVISNQELLYLVIHDKTGRVIVNLAPGNVLAAIPADIQAYSLTSPELTTQRFRLREPETTVYEFAKPVFDKGERTGTIRLGFKLPAASVFSPEHISFFSMVIFFNLSAVCLLYFGVVLALKPLRNRYQSLSREEGDMPDTANKPSTDNNLIPLITDLEQSLGFMHKKLDEIRGTNIELTSKLGVMNFEKNRYIKTLDSINFGILIVDMHNDIWNINEYLLKLLHRQREEVIDRPVAEVFPQRDVVSFITHQTLIEHQGGLNYRDTSFPDEAPGEIYRVTLSLFQGTDKTPIGKAILFRNITSLKLEQKAQQEFIAHIAHELMTPLTNIKSYSEILIDGEVENEEMQKEFYNTINQETTRLSKLIQNLMSISRMEMGSLTVNKGLLRTDWLVDGCLSAIEASARDKSITIEKNLPDVFPSIIADKELLKAAIINILGNAVKYTPANGKITFSIFEEQDSVVFDIADTGYGISSEDLPHVFDKFYRSGNPQVTAQTGSGLGLAIAAETVQLHRGRIDVVSSLGKGSRFTITMPKEAYVLANQ
ncbi:MAG: hypothetical protein HY742_03945 [Deltaproteobacteria bacterium]|nr:hypothetical protein [Deltaproteobacteria bacterium]